MLFFVNAHEEVIRLDISVKEMIIVQVFDPLDHLVANHGYGLET